LLSISSYAATTRTLTVMVPPAPDLPSGGGGGGGGEDAPDADGGQGLTLVHIRAQLEPLQDTFMS
jgi:hypothetical protein